MKISREFLAGLTFRPFKEIDYMGFAGVESPNPMIAAGVLNGESFVVILDGGYCELYVEGNDEFGATDTCENVRELPFKTDKQLAIEAEIAAMEKSLAALKAQL